MAVLTHVVNPARRERNEVDQVTAAVTLTAADSGKWYELAASAGVTVTLPAVSSGLNFRFVVANAFDTSNYVIDSAEGDNIDGNLIVNGAAVAASGEDQINFVASAESVGDWGIGNSAGAITATDPS